MQALLDTTSVEVPKSLVEGEIERLRDRMRQDLAARGIPVKEECRCRRKCSRSRRSDA